MFSAGGGHQWSRRFVTGGGPSPRDAVADLRFDGQGGLWLAGTFTGSIDLGCGPLDAAGGSDVFVARLAASDGTCLRAERFGGDKDDAAMALDLAPTGELVLGGTFEGALTFGKETKSSAGGVDSFLVKLAP